MGLMLCRSAGIGIVSEKKIPDRIQIQRSKFVKGIGERPPEANQIKSEKEREVIPWEIKEQ